MTVPQSDRATFARVRVGTLWQLHDDDTLRQIDEAALHLLTTGGCRIEHEGLLHMLEGAGCHVDTLAMRCYFPERLVRDVLVHVGGRAEQDVEIPAGWNPQHHLHLGGSNPHLLDWPSGHRRLATKQDVIDMAKMGHVLDEFEDVGRVLTCSEVDRRIEPLWATLTLAKITDKRIRDGEIFFPDYIEPLVRMGEVLNDAPGDTSLVASCDFFIAPLILDRTQAECFLEKRRFGIANVPGTMPISGMSGPVTIAGTIAIAVAELLAGWVLGYVVNPDLPVGGIVATGSLDMRTALACFGSPEALLQDMTTFQVCHRLYGIPIYAATNYVDCKHPGLDAVFQKMLPLLAAPFGTSRTIGGDGLLSAGQDYSPVQHLLDFDIRQAIARFWGGFDVNEDTIALELIEEMMAKDATNFLDTEHTMRHFKSEQWYPKWLDRSLWRGTSIEIEAEHKMLERIDRYWKDAVERYQKPDVDQLKIDELRRIYQTAERKILKS
jgi:trimethylamine--corrinoid protein Co-methyltransferase